MTAEVETPKVTDEPEAVYSAARMYGIDVLTAGCILDVFAKMAADEGKPLQRFRQARWNDDGERIGPKDTIALPDSYAYDTVVERVADVIATAAAEWAAGTLEY